MVCLCCPYACINPLYSMQHPLKKALNIVGWFSKRVLIFSCNYLCLAPIFCVGWKEHIKNRVHWGNELLRKCRGWAERKWMREEVRKLTERKVVEEIAAPYDIFEASQRKFKWPYPELPGDLVCIQISKWSIRCLLW